MKSEVLSAVFLLIGAAFILVAGLGVLRFPDLFTRMHAASKAGSLGLGCVLVAVSVTFPEVAVITKSVLVLVFVFLTAPVAAHMIGRAAYLLGVPLWKGTTVDELASRSDAGRRRQRSS